MNASPDWNPKVEAGSRDALRKLQAAKLRAVALRAYEKSPFWRDRFDEAGFDPTTVSSVDDVVKRIPPMSRAEWMAAQQAHPPFGELLAVPRDSAIRYHHTSGTTGRTPLRVLDGMRDWEWIAECWAVGFWGFGIRPTDTVFFAFSYGSFIGFWGAHYACEEDGGPRVAFRQHVDRAAREADRRNESDGRLRDSDLRDPHGSGLAKEMGIDLAKEAKVRRFGDFGRARGNIPATKRLIEGLWGGKACDTAGMTELGTIMMFECEHQPGGCHILEDHYIEEVLDPETLRPVPYGEKGERVVTSFGRGAVPIFRYRTSDPRRQGSA
jgi:phenylacetate-CoA ligase